jgi:hypothetical protein
MIDMNKMLDDIDYLKLGISDVLRKDLAYDRHNDVEMNSRRVAMRVIFHLLRLKTEIWYANDMNFDVGYGCLEAIAKNNGIEMNYYDDLGKSAEALVTIIDAEIGKCRDAMGYSADDIDALTQVTG